MTDQTKESGGFEVEEDFAFQKREWRAERVGWLLMLAVAAASIAGLTGSGPLARASAGGSSDGRLRIEYDRFSRYEAPAELKIEARADGRGELRVAIDRAFFERAELRDVCPEPVRAEIGATETTYVFAVAAGAPEAEVIFRYAPEAIGRHRIGVRDAAGDRVECTGFVFP